MTNFNADPLAAREIDALREAVRLLAFRVRYLETLSAGLMLCDDMPEPVTPLSVGSPGVSRLASPCDHVHPGAFDATPGRHLGAYIFSTYVTDPDSENNPSVGISYTTEVEP